MDCIILAGNRKNYLEVSHENKAFLPIDDRSILQIMLAELSAVIEIDRFIIVGPKDRIKEHLADERTKVRQTVLIIEQRDDLVGNILEAYDAGATHSSHTRPGHDRPGHDRPGHDRPGHDRPGHDRPGHDRPVLILPSDTPLLTAEEVREFIEQCDMDRYDYVGGVTNASVLQRYYPTDEKPGVRMAYFYCQGEGYRINNMHMVRPYAVGRMNNIRRVYSLRYQKRFLNAMKVVGVLIKQAISSPGAVFYYLGLNIIYWLLLLRLRPLAMWFSQLFTMERLARYISKTLDTRMGIVINSYGGSTLDVDNDEDYHTIRARFDEWLSLQRQLAEQRETS